MRLLSMSDTATGQKQPRRQVQRAGVPAGATDSCQRHFVIECHVQERPRFAAD